MSSSSSATTTATGLMEEAFSAVRARDLDALEQCWHEDVIEDFVVLGEVRGRAAARAFFAELFAAVPDLDFEVVRIHAVDDRTAVGEWRLRGTFDGAPFQGIEPTGREVDLRGVDVMEFADGLLQRNTIYYDGLRFARQIGLLPAEDSPVDRAMLAGFNALARIRRGLL